MRLAFLGTPSAAVIVLRALVGAGHDLVLVVSRPDRRRGRGGALVPSPVKVAALELGLAVSQRAVDAAECGAELGVVVAFGEIIQAQVLERLRLVNLHFSLLPRWRGAAPVERAILAGDSETGVCLMAVEAGLDTGGVYDRRSLAIGEGPSAADLRCRLATLGAEMLVDRLAGGLEGLGAPEAQVGEAVYAAKLSRDELRLEWDRPAVELARVVRCGRAWTTVRGRRLLVLEAAETGEAGGPGPPARPLMPTPPARPLMPTPPPGPAQPPPPPGTLLGTWAATASGWLELGVVQPEGRLPMPAADWLRGARLEAGAVLGS